MEYAILSNEPNYTIFQFGNYRIRFRAPHSLEYYSSIKKWDHGYLVVMAKYRHNRQAEEEYIDLVPILKKLNFDVKTFLEPIKEVRIEYVGIPLSGQYKAVPASLQKAVHDSRYRKNLSGPFDSGEDAVVSMLED